MIRLNLGCGSDHKKDWTNVDFSSTFEPDVVADVRELPYDDDAVDEIWASHLLEHFGCEEPVLEEWHRVLVPGGTITIIVPDIVGTYYLSRHGGHWGRNKNPIDMLYVNAVAYGAHIISDDWNPFSHTHKQIFIYDMLVERMRPLFPDAHEITSYEERVSAIGETMVQGHKP